MMTLQIGMKAIKSKLNIKPKLSQAAFTLIELVLVILFIAILAALSTPLFRNTFTDLELKNTTFNLSKTINYAQEMAIIDRTIYRLNFDFENGRYWVTKLGVAEGKNVFEKLGNKYGRDFVFPRGITFTSDEDKINFYPDGRSDTAEIKIGNTKGNGESIILQGFGSRIEVKEN
ncbi:MAG: hypothetical protein ABIH57_00185 [Candidatus Omnitrophota bacterium]